MTTFLSIWTNDFKRQHQLLLETHSFNADNPLYHVNQLQRP